MLKKTQNPLLFVSSSTNIEVVKEIIAYMVKFYGSDISINYLNVYVKHSISLQKVLCFA